MCTTDPLMIGTNSESTVKARHQGQRQDLQIQGRVNMIHSVSANYCQGCRVAACGVLAGLQKRQQDRFGVEDTIRQGCRTFFGSQTVVTLGFIDQLPRLVRP